MTSRPCSEPGCDMKVITRGLCRRHYNMKRASGELEMVGTGKKGGRPKGPALAAPPPNGWENTEPVSKAELQDLSRKRMKHILLDPGAGQAEVNTVLRIIGGWEDKESDSGKLAKFQELMGQTKGLKAVGDERST